MKKLESSDCTISDPVLTFRSWAIASNHEALESNVTFYARRYVWYVQQISESKSTLRNILLLRSSYLQYPLECTIQRNFAIRKFEEFLVGTARV
jgi:hypothetical protein